MWTSVGSFPAAIRSRPWKSIRKGCGCRSSNCVDRGVENATLMDVIAANVRVPDQVLGDIHAQMTACLAGEREFSALLQRYGVDVVVEHGEALQDYSERMARAAIAEIPDGTYRFVDHIDGLGEDPQPIEFRVAVTVRGDELTVDWTGTSQQVKGGINTPLSFCKSNVYAALRSVMPPEVPNCHGYTRPIHVIAPEGSLVNARYPAPCGARGITGYRMVDCIFGALASGCARQSSGGWCRRLHAAEFRRMGRKEAFRVLRMRHGHLGRDLGA